jgi:hypothetical protein
LTFDGQNQRPSWSPDGKELAFFSTRGNGSIWRAPADGSTPGERALDGPPLNGSAAVSWTRDGKWIVWDGQIDGNRGAGGDDVYANPTEGRASAPRPVVATPFMEQSAEVSPDGKWIAYISDDLSSSRLYIQPFMASGGRSPVSVGQATEPVWISNNELAYVNTDSDSVTLARLEFGATVRVTRTSLFDQRPYLQGIAAWRNYDVAPGGGSFIFAKPLQRPASVDAIVVLNWAEEVKRLMLAAGVR